ncbi:MAG: nucleoside triphosphate pyrophosphohydrolase [Desulfobacula sp.]|uniref:nucleoside triphosphate pyrophosphohydrolase n=1 Tax=Desulfobacula sp. TaxID=2593537 RepID=UPI001E1247D3|nr:nucleoside triphosphate pyrophosphohydrolase [Desulfobacula sp.]MBT3487356.1 nucleoside triphosphate pyrophosphohydrolase [Desulfobacula sp.]MBT3806588.1 nucleoside triphosphate pyrophosphohydrolase [Desulfobacula sp.]MBT4026916.1 nucleoside triphosphate pyrophosphohydrolase [Desulfobacula sp.]MBT4200712.1 nucleoside triphosphate pyrophosphohydrolase [Desulfobacula sp.]
METLDSLFNIIQTLRSEKGCDWDRKQTPETMWKCLAEETYELEEAISKKDLQNICEELGDVLFQLIFILEIFQEKQAFTFSDVVKQVVKKMIRRHPHVYEDAKVSSDQELFLQWEAIKALENKGKGQNKTSVLDSVPKGMPSLIRALKVSKCAVKEGFDWENIHEVLETVKEEINEFEAALKTGDKNEASMEFGDILFTLVNVARVAQFHPETALSNSTAKFEGRFRLMEKELKKNKIRLKDLSKYQTDQLWTRAKKSYENNFSSEI